MSSKRPNLTIEIQQLGQQFNSKFKGYIEHPASPKSQHQQYHQYQSHHQTNYLPKVQIKNTQICQRTQNSRVSRDSGGSERSLLLGRAEQVILENRLAQNVRSLSKRKWKKVGNGQRAVGIGRVAVDRESNERSQGSQRSDHEDLELRRRFLSEKKEIGRCKSATNFEHSRAKILEQIAYKLGKVSRIHTSNDEQNHSLMENSQIQYQQSQTKSQVQKIKQIKQHMQKTRGGKLQHLLKDIKKSNKESYKVVYTIKKSMKSGCKRHASPSGVPQADLKQQGYIGNGFLNPNGNPFHTPQSFQSQQNTNKKYINNQLTSLAIQLQNVRFQLKEVKDSNDQLLEMSKNQQKFRNEQDEGSQSSRLTNKILQFDLASIDSSSKNNGTHYTNANNQSNFVKSLPFPVLYSAGERQISGDNVVRRPIVMQACFACGCTCMKRGK